MVLRLPACYRVVPMPPKLVRAFRIAVIYAAAFAFLAFRFASGIVRETEADAFVHWALFPIGFLLGLGAASLDMSGTGSVTRRDMLWGLAAALMTFAIVRFAKLS